MKSTYIHTNNNGNRIKPTRAAKIAQSIVEESPDFRFSDVRAVVSGILFMHPRYTDAAVRRNFYYKLMNEMFNG